MTTPWLDEALKSLGVREAPGTDNDPEILAFGRDAGIDWFVEDSTAWCAVFVNACLVRAGYPSTGSALARSFCDYGVALAEPIPGALVVFPRGKNPIHGHAGIVTEVDRRTGDLEIVNGNVADQVRISRRRRMDVLPDGIRWPPGAPLPEGVLGVREDEGERALGRRHLRLGAAGSDVRALQSLLVRLGVGLAVDGIFGGRTRDAVVRFQKRMRLAADGVVGEASLAALETALAGRAAHKERVATAAPAAAAGGIAGTIGGPLLGPAIEDGAVLAKEIEALFARLEGADPGALAIAAVAGLVLLWRFVGRRRGGGPEGSAGR